MYFKKDSRQNLLNLDDIYASLKKIHSNGMLEFEFRYSVKQSDAIKNSSTKVDVVVFTRTVKKRSILGTTGVGKIDSKKLVDNILTDFTAAKTALKQQENYVLFRRFSDISAFIDNQVVSDIRSGKLVKDIPSLFKSKLKLVSAGELKRKNELKPVLYNLDLKVEDVEQKLSASINDDCRSLSYDLILRRGIDPSAAASITSKSLTPFQSFQGLGKTINRFEPDEGTLSRLHDHLTLQTNLLNDLSKNSNDIDDSKLIETISIESTDEVTIPVAARFFVPKDVINVFVKFDLLDSKTGAAIDSITRLLPVFDHVKIYNTPLKSPSVSAANVNNNKSSLLIKQTDTNANAVRIYKKLFYASATKADQYQLIGVYPLVFNQTKQVLLDRPINGSIIYRCISARDNVLSSTFTNVVVKSARFSNAKSSSLTSLLVDDGVMLEARNLPPNITSIQFLKKNLSNFQKDFSPIGKHILVDNPIRQSDYASVFLSDVNDGNIYEFKLKLFFKNGTTSVVDSEIIEFTKPEQGKVDISISNVSVSSNDISFDVDLNIFDSDLDQIKALLEKQGISSYFENDVQKQREQLKSLLACSVHRVNMTTGEKEYFGILSGPRFSDSDMRKKVSAKPLASENRYRYTITAVARLPETVFDAYEKTSTDPITKKPYTYKPAKFFHPFTLKKGTILDISAKNKTKLGKSILEHGSVGSTKHIDLSIFDFQISVTELNASKFDLKQNIITWRVQGNINLIDHFVIMKQVHGIRTIIGYAHNVFSDGSCQWIHELSKNDHGQLQYIILPIFNDYTRGQTLTSNMILVEDV
jgi:hypothetical protein